MGTMDLPPLGQPRLPLPRHLPRHQPIKKIARQHHSEDNQKQTMLLNGRRLDAILVFRPGIWTASCGLVAIQDLFAHVEASL